MQASPLLKQSVGFVKGHFWTLLALFVGILVPLLFFGKLAEEVFDDGGLSLDVPVLEFIRTYASPRRDFWVGLVTRWSSWLAIPVLLAAVFALRYFLKQRANAIFFGVAVFGSWGLNLAVKAVFQRARPALWESPAPDFGYSFPSGHAMVSMTIAAVLVLVAWPSRLRWWLVVAAVPTVVIIGVSRLYLGVHYPSDIVAGWAASLVWVTGVYLLMRKTINSDNRDVPQDQVMDSSGANSS